jgi:hypothetical protein
LEREADLAQETVTELKASAALEITRIKDSQSGALENAQSD